MIDLFIDVTPATHFNVVSLHIPTCTNKLGGSFLHTQGQETLANQHEDRCVLMVQKWNNWIQQTTNLFTWQRYDGTVCRITAGSYHVKGQPTKLPNQTVAYHLPMHEHQGSLLPNRRTGTINMRMKFQPKGQDNGGESKFPNGILAS